MAAHRRSIAQNQVGRRALTRAVRRFPPRRAPVPTRRRERRGPWRAAGRPRPRAAVRSALCGVELSRPKMACMAVRSLAGEASGLSSLVTVTHSSTYSRCRRRIFRLAGSGTLASSRSCTVIRSGWLSAKLTCQSSSASRAAAASAAASARRLPSASSRSLMPTQHLREYRVLAGEMPVDAGTRHAGGRADVVDRDTVEAAAREQGGRRGEDLLAARSRAARARAPAARVPRGPAGRRGRRLTHCWCSPPHSRRRS